ncbi:MAG: hypothetical protein GX207_09830 [Peptococcaceae bacterium]|mgnify:FL=1|nr:hypothetical protein [Peptococcaceae bacterium]
MFAKKSNNNWIKIGSAMIGGFLLGISYKKYGKNLSHHWRNMKRNMDYNDFIPSDEPEV